MAEVQSLHKPECEWIRSCAQLAEHFSNCVLQTHTVSNEVRLIFDRFDLPFSLKVATGVRRQGSQAPVYYHITDKTHIAKVPMKRLLSHAKTKMELTIYLGQKIKNMLIVVESNWWWHGEVFVKQHTRTKGIYRVTKTKLTQR